MVIQDVGVNLEDGTAQGIQKIKIYALNFHPYSCIRYHGPIYDAAACYSRPQLQETVKFQKCIFENAFFL